MPIVEQDSTQEEVEVIETAEDTANVETEDQQETPQDETPTAVADLPEWAQELIHNLREENASRRVSNRNQSEVLEQILGVVRELSPEQDATAETEATPPATQNTSKNIADELAKVVGRMNRDNNVLRVSLETGFPVDVVESFRGETYDDLMNAANKLTAIVPDKKTTKEPAKKNQPAKAPAGNQQQSGRSNAEREAIYFGSARNAGGIFGGGGVKTFRED